MKATFIINSTEKNDKSWRRWRIQWPRRWRIRAGRGTWTIELRNSQLRGTLSILPWNFYIRHRSGHGCRADEKSVRELLPNTIHRCGRSQGSNTRNGQTTRKNKLDRRNAVPTRLVLEIINVLFHCVDYCLVWRLSDGIFGKRRRIGAQVAPKI